MVQVAAKLIFNGIEQYLALYARRNDLVSCWKTKKACSYSPTTASAVQSSLPAAMIEKNITITSIP